VNTELKVKQKLIEDKILKYSTILENQSNNPDDLALKTIQEEIVMNKSLKVQTIEKTITAHKAKIDDKYNKIKAELLTSFKHRVDNFTRFQDLKTGNNVSELNFKIPFECTSSTYINKKTGTNKWFHFTVDESFYLALELFGIPKSVLEYDDEDFYTYEKTEQLIILDIIFQLSTHFKSLIFLKVINILSGESDLIGAKENLNLTKRERFYQKFLRSFGKVYDFTLEDIKNGNKLEVATKAAFMAHNMMITINKNKSASYTFKNLMNYMEKQTNEHKKQTKINKRLAHSYESYMPDDESSTTDSDDDSGKKNHPTGGVVGTKNQGEITVGDDNEGKEKIKPIQNVDENKKEKIKESIKNGKCGSNKNTNINL